MATQRNHNDPRFRGEPQTLRTVAPPPPHEGIRRALKGSFGSVAIMPEEFVQLLDRLH